MVPVFPANFRPVVHSNQQTVRVPGLAPEQTKGRVTGSTRSAQMETIGTWWTTAGFAAFDRFVVGGKMLLADRSHRPVAGALRVSAAAAANPVKG